MSWRKTKRPRQGTLRGRFAVGGRHLAWKAVPRVQVQDVVAMHGLRRLVDHDHEEHVWRRGGKENMNKTARGIAIYLFDAPLREVVSLKVLGGDGLDIVAERDGAEVIAWLNESHGIGHRRQVFGFRETPRV